MFDDQLFPLAQGGAVAGKLLKAVRAISIDLLRDPSDPEVEKLLFTFHSTLAAACASIARSACVGH